MTADELAALAADMNRADTVGDCFALALDLVMTNPTALLCHGVVTGNGANVVHDKYWHAWAELDGDRGTICIDRTQHNREVASRSEYYEAARVEHVTRYTPSDALANIRRANTAGPWL